MDGGIPAWITGIAVLFGGAIGWFSHQYWQYRSFKRQKERDDIEKLKNGRKLIKEKIPEEKDFQKKQKLLSDLNDVDDVLIDITKKTVQSYRRKQRGQ